MKIRKTDALCSIVILLGWKIWGGFKCCVSKKYARRHYCNFLCCYCCYNYHYHYNVLFASLPTALLTQGCDFLVFSKLAIASKRTPGDWEVLTRARKSYFPVWTNKIVQDFHALCYHLIETLPKTQQSQAIAIAPKKTWHSFSIEFQPALTSI